MTRPKTVKLYFPGEVVAESFVVATSSGELIEVVKKKNFAVPSKKNQKQIVKNKATGKDLIVPSKQFKRWKKVADKIFATWYEKLFTEGVRLPIVRCNMKCLFYYADARDRDNHNKFETICDMLQEHGIIASDSFKVLNDESMRGVVKRDKPRTEIFITILDPSHTGYEWDETGPQYAEQKRIRKNMLRRASRQKQKSDLQPDPDQKQSGVRKKNKPVVSI